MAAYSCGQVAIEATLMARFRNRRPPAEHPSRLCIALCAGVLLGVPGAAVRAVLPPGGAAGPRTQGCRRFGSGTQAAGTSTLSQCHNSLRFLGVGESAGAVVARVLPQGTKQ